mgnify:CR=1 FL=1
MNILIACDYIPHHNWMSFLCWHSLSKNLPEAKVTVACHRRLMTYDFFGWTRKCKVPFVLHKAADEKGQIALISESVQGPLLVLSPETVCIRDFAEAGFSPDVLSGVVKMNSELCCDCKEEKPCVFVTYLSGWGKFVTQSWINRMSCPFVSGVKYGQGVMTSNEVRIGQLWSSVTPLFQIMSGG